MILKTRKKTRRNRKKKTFKRGFRFKLFLLLALGVSYFSYHLYQHPSLIFYPASGLFYKSSKEIWNTYGEQFIEYSSPKLDPLFLAALSQVESNGNPLALTYWRLSMHWNPFLWYRPASTATGILQVTAPTWKQMKRFCIVGGRLIENKKDGNCYANRFRFRIFAGHSIHLVAAWFRHHLRNKQFTPKQARMYLSTLHLCGPGKAIRIRKNGFNASRLGYCGSHKLIRYIGKVEKSYQRMQKTSRNLDSHQIAANNSHL